MSKYLTDSARLFIGPYEISQDTTRLEIGSVCRDIPSTGLSQSAEKVIAGLYGGEFRHDGMLDDDSGKSNAALAALISTTPVVTVTWQTHVSGIRAISGLFLETAFKAPTPLGGLLMARAEGRTDGKVLTNANLLHFYQTRVGNDNSESLDNGAASSNGGVGFVHVFATDGTVDFSIQESSDDGGGDAFADIINFTQFSAIGTEQKSVSGAVERYVRSRIVLGTATSVTFMIGFARL